MTDTEIKKNKRHWWILPLTLAAALLIGAGVEWATDLSMPIPVTIQMTLLGDREITLEYGQDYTEPGATACAMLAGWEMRELAVTAGGEVDPEKVGEYEIIYTSGIGSIVCQEHRVIRIQDTQPPVITLISNPDTYTLPGHAYEEEGFSAEDNYDGDLTSQVVREQTDGAVIYSVADSSGNTFSVTREIVYNDPIPPELVLEGDTEITMTQGAAYEEPGFSATDNCDGDISDQVEVSGFVDIYVPGTYTLEYFVSDQYGNTATATRTVKVEEITGRGGTVYLTFDDGPGKYTSKLLDVLDKYNVKATFFVVNTGYRKTMARAAAAGHTIAIHSASHNYKKIYANEEAYFEDLYQMQSIIQEYTGQTATLIRFPGGSSNTVSRFNKGIMTRLTKAVTEQGFKYFDWNVSSGDAGVVSTSNEVYINVITGISKHNVSVVLQHDTHAFSVDAVERIIQWGQEYGYTFLPLTSDSPGAHQGVNN